MSGPVTRTIVDLEWPTRYVLACGHAVPIAPDASAAEMAMPGQAIACPDCSGASSPAPPAWLPPFEAGEPINALTLNARLSAIAERLQAGPEALTPFEAAEPINAETLNRRLSQIAALLG